MTNEEVFEIPAQPLVMEIEYANDAETDVTYARNADITESENDEVKTSAVAARSLFPDAAEDVSQPEKATKKSQILKLYEQGQTDIAALAHLVGARPSYIAQVLQSAGLLKGYFDLYTTTRSDQNVYSRFFRNVLSFKTVNDARDSVRKIDRLYNYFERIGDRAGQHQAMVLALTGKNRARWSGKHSEADIFGQWLATH